jgi:hypothetical protein
LPLSLGGKGFFKDATDGCCTSLDCCYHLLEERVQYWTWATNFARAEVKYSAPLTKNTAGISCVTVIKLLPTIFQETREPMIRSTSSIPTCGAVGRNTIAEWPIPQKPFHAMLSLFQCLPSPLLSSLAIKRTFFSPS